MTHAMTVLSDRDMLRIEGGGFWEGFACGAGIAASVFVTVSQDPISKLTQWTVYSGTLAACGIALT